MIVLPVVKTYSQVRHVLVIVLRYSDIFNAAIGELLNKNRKHQRILKILQEMTSVTLMPSKHAQVCVHGHIASVLQPLIAQITSAQCVATIYWELIQKRGINLYLYCCLTP